MRAEHLLDARTTRVGIDLLDARDGCAQRLHVRAQEAGLSVGDHFGRRTAGEREHRRAACVRFGHHQAERLLPLDREQHGARARHQVRLLIDRDLAEDLLLAGEDRLHVLVPIGLLELLFDRDHHH